MKVAIIDLGTNTFNLLIAVTRKNGNYDLVLKTKIPVKLGQGGIDKGIIAPDALKRGMEALKTHKQTIEEYQVKKYRAFATSAIRSTSNGVEFVRTVKKKLGLIIEIIDGKKEAELIFHGVKQISEFKSSYDLIMDIGGGSTEFIIANKNGIAWSKSYKLGVSRLKEIFKPKDKISDDNIIQITNHLDESLQELFDALSKYRCDRLIGSSGSFDSIVEMIAHQFKNEEEMKRPCATIHKMEFKWVYEYLINSTLNDRINTPGLAKMRADMIVISVVFINYLLKKTGIDKVNRSKFALKEGALAQCF